ncbi:hypothetical protein, partial [Phaeovulum veldkampii]|uniref:hypothetical protein n=1 Tax=Phaeovulum veldkampii TaxID=33049 RepID=UPI001AECE13E
PGSVYLLVFIRNLLVHLAEKILLLQPLKFGGDYLNTCPFWQSAYQPGLFDVSPSKHILGTPEVNQIHRGKDKIIRVLINFANSDRL